METNVGEIIGIFIGLDSSKYEYIASIIAPFQPDYAPVIGGFMLIDNITEYIIARVMDYIPQGEMVSFMGKKWLSEVALTPELIGQEIKTRKVSYQVKIKLLGRLDKESKKFTPGIKNIPHITSRVIKPTINFIETICNQALGEMIEGIKIGSYWLNSEIDIHFNMKELVGKRTFIFARAGYGKSNLMKIIASKWKKESGSIIIFDPEGEYAVTDRKGRPGILDQIPAILITNRINLKEQVQANIYTNLKFDLREFYPKFIIPILVSEEKYGMVFFQKLMSINKNQWMNLVNYLQEMRYAAEYEKVADTMGIKYKSPVDITPILNNLIPAIDQLHDPNSKLITIIDQAVKLNYPMIIDISLLDSRSALQLSSIIISHFFNKNQRKFTGGKEDLDKITFVVEEAQSVIGGKSNVAKFVELAKEGRKYQLGGIFITQQPGSISREILSQGDNFFVFHLLSKGDLKALMDSNAHFSSDILTQILNEPIRGKAYMWTSNQPFVLPVYILNFEDIAKPYQAKKVQSNNNLLKNVLNEIVSIDKVEEGICNKFNTLLNNLGIQISMREKIFSDQYKTQITKGLFKVLTDVEKEYLDEKNGIAKGNGVAFAIHFKYLDTLYENARIYIERTMDK